MTIRTLIAFLIALALSSSLEFALGGTALFLMASIADSLQKIALYQKLETLAAVDPERIK